MTAKDASRIVTETRTDKTIIECLDFPQFYAFYMVDKGSEGENYYGCYYTVDKHNGAVGTFNPTSDLDALFAAKKIDLAEIKG